MKKGVLEWACIAHESLEKCIQVFGFATPPPKKKEEEEKEKKGKRKGKATWKTWAQIPL